MTRVETMPFLEGAAEINQAREITQRKRLPSSVDFMLLGTCDLRCPFCFGPQHEIRAMKTEVVKSVIQTLAANGTESVVFTGGEPTLINDLPAILREAKDNGLTTVLSTNGLRLARDPIFLEQVVSSLDWIALPLDGNTPEINGRMRIGLSGDAELKHFDTVLGLIRKLRDEYPQLKIKIGTVVAKLNLEHIVNIPEVLRRNNAIPDTWKLYQVSPSEYGKLNYDYLEVSDDEFERVSCEAERRAKEFGIPNVFKYTNATRPGKYLFINPKGDALIVDQKDNDYHTIGNIIANPEEVFNNWQAFIDEALLLKNFEETYPRSTL